MLPNCKKPRDEGKITRNRKAHMDIGGRKGGNKGGDNTRKKWSKDGGEGNGYQNNDNSNHGNGGVHMMENKWMFLCKAKALWLE